MSTPGPETLYRESHESLKGHVPNFSEAIQLLQAAIDELAPDDPRRQTWMLERGELRDQQQRQAEVLQTEFDRYLEAHPPAITHAEQALQDLRLVDPQWSRLRTSQERLDEARRREEAETVYQAVKRAVDELLVRGYQGEEHRKDARNHLERVQHEHADNPLLRDQLSELARYVDEEELKIARAHDILTTRAQTEEWHLIQNVLQEMDERRPRPDKYPIYTFRYSESSDGGRRPRLVEVGWGSRTEAYSVFDEAIASWSDDIVRSRCTDALRQFEDAPEAALSILETKIPDLAQASMSDRVRRELEGALETVRPRAMARQEVRQLLRDAEQALDKLEGWRLYLQARARDAHATGELCRARERLLPGVRTALSRQFDHLQRRLADEVVPPAEIEAEAHALRVMTEEDEALNDLDQSLETLILAAQEHQRISQRVEEIRRVSDVGQQKKDLEILKDELGEAAARYPVVQRLEGALEAQFGVYQFKRHLRASVLRSTDTKLLEGGLKGCDGFLEQYPTDDDLIRLRQLVQARIAFLAAEERRAQPRRRLEAVRLYREVVALDGEDAERSQHYLAELEPVIQQAQAAMAAIEDARRLARLTDNDPQARGLEQALERLAGFRDVPAVVETAHVIRTEWENRARERLEELKQAGDPPPQAVEHWTRVLRRVSSVHADSWERDLLARALARAAERTSDPFDKLDLWRRAYEASGGLSEYQLKWHQAGEQAAITLLRHGQVRDWHEIQVVEPRLVDMLVYLRSVPGVLVELAKVKLREGQLELARELYDQARERSGPGTLDTEFVKQLQFEEAKRQIDLRMPQKREQATYYELLEVARLLDEGKAAYPERALELQRWYDQRASELIQSLVQRLQVLTDAAHRKERWEVTLLLLTLAPHHRAVAAEFAGIERERQQLAAWVRQALDDRKGPVVRSDQHMPPPLALINAHLAMLQDLEAQYQNTLSFVSQYNARHRVGMPAEATLDATLDQELAARRHALEQLRVELSVITGLLAQARTMEVRPQGHGIGQSFGDDWDQLITDFSRLKATTPFPEHRSLQALEQQIETERQRRLALQKKRDDLAQALRFAEGSDFDRARILLDELVQADAEYDILAPSVIELRDDWSEVVYRRDQRSALLAAIAEKQQEERDLARWLGHARQCCLDWSSLSYLLQVEDQHGRISSDELLRQIQADRAELALYSLTPSWSLELRALGRLGEIEELRRVGTWEGIGPACLGWLGSEPNQMPLAQASLPLSDRVDEAIAATAHWGSAWSLRQLRAYLAAPPIAPQNERDARSKLKSRAAWQHVRLAQRLVPILDTLIAVAQHYFYMATVAPYRGQPPETVPEELPAWPVQFDGRRNALAREIERARKERNYQRRQAFRKQAEHHLEQLRMLAPAYRALRDYAAQIEKIG